MVCGGVIHTDQIAWDQTDINPTYSVPPHAQLAGFWAPSERLLWQQYIVTWFDLWRHRCRDASQCREISNSHSNPWESTRDLRVWPALATIYINYVCVVLVDNIKPRVAFVSSLPHSNLNCQLSDFTWFYCYKFLCVSVHGFTYETSDFFYSVITFSYIKCFVHSYTVDVVFTLSYVIYCYHSLNVPLLRIFILGPKSSNTHAIH